MKKKSLLFAILLFSFNCFSQISYEKGYFIDNNNQKTDCYILNLDWETNPTKFKYKLTEDHPTNEKTIKSVKEFGIYNFSKYIKNIVNIDTSTESVNDLNSNKVPIFEKKEVFLNVLIEGNANLYLYQSKDFRRYFYNKENSLIEQLIYKSYKIDNKISENNLFRKQLWDNLKCSTLKITELFELKYFKKDLTNLFVKYNKCQNTDYIDYRLKQKRDLLNINVRPGLNYSSFSTTSNLVPSRNEDFGGKLSLRLGVEGEFILPFKKNKWSLIVEPTYQSFRKNNSTDDRKREVNYVSVELPIGLRHYFFLNKNSKLFVNASFIIDFPQNNSIINFGKNSEFEAAVTRDVDDLQNIENFAFGFGYKLDSKYGVEFRYHTKRDLLNNFGSNTSDYQTVSLIFSYSIF